MDVERANVADVSNRAGGPDTVSLSDAARMTGLYALPRDHRFSYCLHVVNARQVDSRRPLLVTVHGTERDAFGMRDAFVPFAAVSGLTVLSPLFPVGVSAAHAADNVDNYKFIRHGDLRFDDLLMQMIGSASDRLGGRFGPVYLVGFSGGAQFAHRFLYLHPELVAGVSIAAPGRVTLLDDSRDWWTGIRDIERIFGCGLDMHAIRKVPVQIVVGADDVDTGVSSRLGQARMLQANYSAMGLLSRLDIVPDARHELSPLIPAITDFIGDQLPNIER